MRRLMPAVCVCAMLGMAACDGESSDDATSLSDVANEARDAADEAAAYASQKKDEIMNTMQDQYAKLKPKIAELEASVKNARLDAESEISKAMNTLKAKREAFEAKWDEFKGASGDAWKDVSSGAKDAYSELEEAFKDAMSKFEDGAVTSN